MLNFFMEFDNQNTTNILKQKYLEIIVNERKIEDERFHTALGLFYVEIIFKLKPKDSEAKIDETDSSFNKLRTSIVKFQEFLRNPNSKYRGSTILEKIKDSWLILDEVYLYGREKQHKKALKKLVKEKDFKKAEEYCAEKTEGLLTWLFEIYIGLFNDLQEVLKSSNDQKKQEFAIFLKKTINDFLKKYATHSELDSLSVLENIPDNWILSEDPENDGVYFFLKNVMSHTLNQKRINKCAKHMSEMDLLNVECTLTKAKKAHIKIHLDKNCSVCHRKIGDKVEFNKK